MIAAKQLFGSIVSHVIEYRLIKSKIETCNTENY